MHNSRIASLQFLACFLLVLTIACHKADNSAQPQPFQIAQSSMARDANPQAPDADLAMVVAGSTDFALKVFPLLDASGNSNIVFSPFSIARAFALAAPGARGTTLSGIEQALSFPLPQDRFNKVMNRLDLLLMNEASGVTTTNGDQLPLLKNANAIWGQSGFSILPDYLDTLAVNYSAGMHLVDFITAAEAARSTINTWVEGQTNNRIQDLLPQGSLTSDTRVVLTNAVWFKSNWASQFQESATSNQTFYDQNGSTSSVPFMRHTFPAPYGQTGGCKAIDIPYVGNKFSMLVIMPDPGTFDAFLSSLTPTALADITGQLTSQEIALSLPKFTFTKEATMGTILRFLGMTDAFDPVRADFSGIDGNRDLSISEVFHKAFVAVEEHGTEAAAATGIVIGVTSAPVQPLALTIDHPFIFVIREIQTDLILFMGKVVLL